MVVPSKSNSRDSRSRLLLTASLVIVGILIVSSLFAFAWLMMTDKGPIYVSNETELRKAVNNAKVGMSVNIILNGDIYLTEGALVIPYGKDITLTSNSTEEFFKLIGTSYGGTILLENGYKDRNGGVLRINGIIVTHSGDYNNGDYDVYGVHVSYYGILILMDGEISNNIGRGGCGVNNYGTFEMYGGVISGNNAKYYGGGVFNNGVFKMFGGEIINNTADMGGGVSSNGYSSIFTMSGGTISGNTALSSGGGVYCSAGTFDRLGGEIFGNTADIDNDVSGP